MRKTVSMLLLSVIAFSSCTTQSVEQTFFSETYPDFFTYEFPDFISTFNVDENGTLYLYTNTYTEQVLLDTQNKKF